MYYFLPQVDKGFTFLPTVCNGYHDILIISIDINIIFICDIYGVDCLSIIVGITKNEVIN